MVMYKKSGRLSRGCVNHWNNNVPALEFRGVEKTKVSEEEEGKTLR